MVSDDIAYIFTLLSFIRETLFAFFAFPKLWEYECFLFHSLHLHIPVSYWRYLKAIRVPSWSYEFPTSDWCLSSNCLGFIHSLCCVWLGGNLLHLHIYWYMYQSHLINLIMCSRVSYSPCYRYASSSTWRATISYWCGMCSHFGDVGGQSVFLQLSFPLAWGVTWSFMAKGRRISG